MPSRASTSFLRWMEAENVMTLKRQCQCPLGLVPHFYTHHSPYLGEETWCQCPLGLVPHFYLEKVVESCKSMSERVNALTGLYLISTYVRQYLSLFNQNVSMPSRAYTSFLRQFGWVMRLPLTSVSMPSRAYTSFLLCQDIRHKRVEFLCVNALTGLYLISTVPLQKPRFYAVSRACFCRYLSEYSDNNCFSCMLTIWTYLTRYTYL